MNTLQKQQFTFHDPRFSEHGSCGRYTVGHEPCGDHEEQGDADFARNTKELLKYESSGGHWFARDLESVVDHHVV